MLVCMQMNLPSMVIHCKGAQRRMHEKSRLIKKEKIIIYKFLVQNQNMF